MTIVHVTMVAMQPKKIEVRTLDASLEKIIDGEVSPEDGCSVYVHVYNIYIYIYSVYVHVYIYIHCGFKSHQG